MSHLTKSLDSLQETFVLKSNQLVQRLEFSQDRLQVALCTSFDVTIALIHSIKEEDKTLKAEITQLRIDRKVLLKRLFAREDYLPADTSPKLNELSPIADATRILA